METHLRRLFRRAHQNALNFEVAAPDSLKSLSQPPIRLKPARAAIEVQQLNLHLIIMALCGSRDSSGPALRAWRTIGLSIITMVRVDAMTGTDRFPNLSWIGFIRDGRARDAMHLLQFQPRPTGSDGLEG